MRRLIFWLFSSVKSVQNNLLEAAEEVISPTRSRLYLDSYLIYQKEEEGFDFGDRRESSGSGDILEKESVSIEEWVDVWGETVSVNT